MVERAGRGADVGEASSKFDLERCDLTTDMGDPGNDIGHSALLGTGCVACWSCRLS